MGVLSRRPPRAGLARSCAALALLAGAGACARDATAPYSNLYSVRFAEVWTRFQYNDPLFGVSGVEWGEQWDAYEPRARQLRSQAEFVGLLQEMLAPLHDSQVWLVRPDGSRLETFPAASRPSNWDEATLRTYATRGIYRQVSDDLAWGRVGEVGYVLLGSLERGRITPAAVDQALDSLRTARSIIIDLRTNAGGDMGICDSLAGRFLTTGRYYGYIRWRQGEESGVLSAMQGWGVNPRSPAITRPIILLTGRRTAGAAEQLVLALRGLGQVTVVGDTTAGSMGSSWVFDLGDGWGYAVPRFLWHTPQRTVIEGVGLGPNIYVRATSADFVRHVDPVLDTALARGAGL